ncbi:MAG: DUF3300 domain-containing protein [Pseudomonadota bacterium]
MKAATLFRPAFGLFVICSLVFSLMFFPQPARAEDSDDLEPSEKFSQEELAQMLAPIALYPDALLSQVLMASTYPIEVVEADRWVQKNPELKGDDLDAALLDMEWDSSVKAVCHFPSILALMSERISETTDLGNAFLAQEAEVMDMVQELRARAHAQNRLATDSRQKVIVENEKIIIEPADPGVIYVSYYDPSYVYGPWWYPAYPPYYWGPPGVRIGVGISYWPAFYFGFAFGSWSHFDWHRHYIHMDVDRRPRFVRHDRWIGGHGRWIHAPEHRRGVVYRDRSTAWKYQQPHRSRDYNRDTRIPEHRDPDRDRRGGDRNRIEPGNRGVDRTKMDHDRRERERVEIERKARERVDHDRREQQPVDRRGLERDHADRNRKIHEQAEQNRPPRKDAENHRQEHQVVEAEVKKRQRAEQEKPQVRPVDSGKQERDNAEHERRERERVEREQQQNSNNTVSPLVDQGKESRPSGTRGGSGRPPGPGDNAHGKSRSSDTDRGGHDDRGHNRR